MTAAAVLNDARAAGVTLWRDGDALRYRGSREALTADLLDQLKAHKAAILEALAARAPVNLDGALAAACGACDTSAGITPTMLRAMLSPEDLQDIQAGDIPVETLHGYAELFAEGLRSGRIVVPRGEHHVTTKEEATP